ncbi:hypothetical protein LCGC14_2761410 [marine sediment metagenome]|uniref:DZANK-type domain-containing protein n=1 Tax=marine sediment metagenome TaxID=412755 RepID=A0A0F9BQG1_9ZZZZ
MRTKFIEILIVVLFAVAFVSGCKGKTELVNGIECKRHGSGWQPIENFCPKCGEFSPWEKYCSSCGTKNYEGTYQFACSNDHRTYITDLYWKSK